MTHRQARVAACACCALAFLLATWTLDARGLWGDEAFSVWASKQPATALIAGLDAQPPLYHLLLGAGRLLWGESVFALRYLSVCCGVLLVAVGAQLGRLIGGSSASAFAALWLAVSPISLYFAQEARMYAPAALFAGGAMLLAVASLKRRARTAGCAAQGGRRDASYVLLSLGALFTHYYVAGVLLVNALALGLAALRSRDARRIVAWLIAHLLIALVFGAWFLGLQSRYASRAIAGRARIVPAFEDIVSDFGVGVNGLLFGMRADGSLTAAALALFALAVVGVIGYWRRGQRGDTRLILGWIVASLGVVAATAGRSGIVGDFNPRYYLFALLPLALAAAGWVVLIEDALRRAVRTPVSRRAVLPFAFVILIALAPAVVGDLQLFDLSWQKSRYDAMVGAIRARAQPNDGAVLVNSDQFPLLAYYGPLDMPVWIVGNDTLNRDPASVEAELSRFAEGKSRLWLVNYGWAMALQPPSVVEQALNQRGARTYAQGFQDVSLALYDLRFAAGDAPVRPQRVRFGGQIALVGVRGRARLYHPGEAVTLDLIWRADQAPRADYTVFMHLRRADDGSQIAAFDSPPVNGAAPTSRWTPGQIVTDTRAVPIPADAPPGEYNVVIGLYLYPTFERLTMDGGEATEHIVERVTIRLP